MQDDVGLLAGGGQATSHHRLVVAPAAAIPVPVVLSRVTGVLARSRPARGGQDLAGLRPWRSGDESREVHWRASARRGRLVVAEREEPPGGRCVLAVVGELHTQHDEDRLAQLIATCERQRALGVPCDVLAWPAPEPTAPHGQPSLAPATSAGLLEWAAALRTLTTPSPEDLVASLPCRVDCVTVLTSSAVCADWWGQAANAGSGSRDVPAVRLLALAVG